MTNGLLKENLNSLYIVRWVGLLSKHQFSLLDFVVYRCLKGSVEQGIVPDSLSRRLKPVTLGRELFLSKRW